MLSRLGGREGGGEGVAYNLHSLKTLLVRFNLPQQSILNVAHPPPLDFPTRTVSRWRVPAFFFSPLLWTGIPRCHVLYIASTDQTSRSFGSAIIFRPSWGRRLSD